MSGRTFAIVGYSRLWARRHRTFPGVASAGATALLVLAASCELVSKPVETALAGAGGAGGADAEGTPNEGPPTTGGQVLNTDANPIDIQACAEGARGEKPKPATVNVLLLVDRSARMAAGNSPPWPALQQALYSLFRTAPPPELPLRVGVQMFPLEEEKADTNVSLSVATYTKPLVPLAALTAADAPNDTQEDLLVELVFNTRTALEKYPGDTTLIPAPTVQAYRGTMGYAVEFARARPDDRVVVLLVTGGYPTADFCAPDGPRSDSDSDSDRADLCAVGEGESRATQLMPEMENTARAGAWNRPPVRTYAMQFSQVAGSGVPAAFDRVARAGGGRCFNCGTVDAVTQQTELSNAILGYLEDLARNEFACQYSVALPERAGNVEVEYNLINVRYRKEDGEWAWLQRVEAERCTGTGWYFDDPAEPRSILLCKIACDSLRRQTTQEVEVVFGCPTDVG